MTDAQRPHPAAIDPTAAWWTLWHEPWIGMAPAWAASGDAAGWPALPTTGPSRRLMYRSFCQRWDVDATAPFPSTQLDADIARLPIDADGLARAALAIGRVGYVSHCLTASRQHLAHLFDDASMADALEAGAWTTALRSARARPLCRSDLTPPEGRAAPALQRWALPLMAQLIDDALPGAWSRLRLRLDPSLIASIDRLDAPASAVVRQTWRLWRGAAMPAGAPNTSLVFSHTHADHEHPASA